MRVALDTNRYVDLARGDAEVVSVIETATAVYMPFVVLAELRAGFAMGSKGKGNESALRRFLSKDGVELSFATEATTRHYANLYRQLRTQGTPIPTNDIWIAALVTEHDLLLCSRDAHFEHLPQIARL